MMIAVDPNLWLFSRLAIGRGWKPIVLIAVSVTVGSALWLHLWSMPLLVPGIRQSGDPGFLFLAFLLLCVGPIRSVARLLDLENGGLLDLTRLSGQRLPRVLAMVIAGTSWPYAIVSAVFVGLHIRIDGDPWSALVAAFLLAAAVDAALVTYWALPGAMAADSAFLTPLLGILTFLALNFLQVVGWIQNRQFSDSQARGTMATIALGFPVAWWLACRRLRRPRAVARRGATDVFDAVSRAVPRIGPPEFMRQFRCTLLSGGTLATLLLSPLAVVLVAWRTQALHSEFQGVVLTSLPYVVALIGPFAVASSVRRAVDTRSIDLVRITPQRAESVVLGWWAGISLPYWIATLLGVGALVAVGSVSLPLDFSQNGPILAASLLAMIALAFPALTLAQALHRRRAGLYMSALIAMTMIVLLFTTIRQAAPTSLVERMSSEQRTIGFQRAREAFAERVRALPDFEWRRAAFESSFSGRRPQPRPLTTFPLSVLIVGLLSLGAAAGRFDRMQGPSLEGAAVVGAVAGVALLLRELPLMALPRVAAALFVVLASFAAEDRSIPTSPWPRLAIACGAVFAAVAFLIRANAISWGGAAAGAACAAAAMAIGLLGHELTWRTPVASVAIRATAFVFMLRMWWIVPDMFGSRSATTRGWAERWVDAPPMLTALEATVLVAAVASLAVAHAVVRGRGRSRPAIGEAR